MATFCNASRPPERVYFRVAAENSKSLIEARNGDGLVTVNLEGTIGNKPDVPSSSTMSITAIGASACGCFNENG